MKRINKYIILLSAILLLTIFIRIGVGEICTVPTLSMEPTIQGGDWIWLNKLSYGGKLPVRFSDIPVINAFTWIPYLRKKDKENNWGYHRIPGFKSPQINDIIVCTNPENTEVLLLKRITQILYKGDVVKITPGNYEKMIQIIVAEDNSHYMRHDSIYINGQYSSEYRIRKNYYHIEGDNKSNSRDSRSFGYITDSAIIGEVSLIIYSKGEKSDKFFRKL